MILSDNCCDCGEVLNLTKRIYRGPDGGGRCPTCQVLAECQLEIAKVTAIVELMADVGEMHMDVVRTTGGRTH